VKEKPIISLEENATIRAAQKRETTGKRKESLKKKTLKGLR